MQTPVRVVNGWVTFPSSLKTPAQAPRFTMEFPIQLANDLGARYLVSHDSAAGYEAPTRNLFEKTLRAGDLFIDVGAHWGFFALQAATHPAGDIFVIAVEPDPANASLLFRNVQGNGLTERVTVVCAACGDGFDVAALVSSSSMGHSIRGIGAEPGLENEPAKWVAVLTLDRILETLPETAGRRVILKIDVEGFEPRVIVGARGLLRSGRVALIVWEYGRALARGVERDALITMIAELSQLGFRHYRPPSSEIDGPLTPFGLDDAYVGNVHSFGPGLEIA